jgi:uncharacterized protein (TIGR03067 family)
MRFRIGNTILVLCFCLAILGSCIRQNRLEGVWIGCETRKPLIDWILNIRGDQFYLFREDLDRWYKGRIKLNNNCVLKKIDLQIHDTHARLQNEKTILGIYEISSDTLTVVVALPGKPVRPLSLDEPRGAMVFNFVRN